MPRMAALERIDAPEAHREDLVAAKRQVLEQSPHVPPLRLSSRVPRLPGCRLQMTASEYGAVD